MPATDARPLRTRPTAARPPLEHAPTGLRPVRAPLNQRARRAVSRLRGAAPVAGLSALAMAASLAVAPGPAGLAAAALVPVLAAIAMVDAHRFIIPDGLTAAGIGLGLLHAALAAPEALAESLAAAGARGAALAALFLAIRIGYRALRGRDGLGLGDVKLAALAGIWLPVLAMPVAIEIAALSALAAYALRQRTFGRALRADGRLPFGLFFAPAIWIAWMLDHALAGMA
ncbi:prepilin peptidase [Xanthobacter sp. AM11]|uniref:prepilin peptidase n=1 Tax=Xanthobacter sp. AM11 TaxID=3380643 RepID=UPI0039BF3260